LVVEVGRGVMRAEARRGGGVDGRVAEGGVELVVAQPGEERRDANVRGLHVLQVALQRERDLDGTLGGARRPAHGRRLPRSAGSRQGGRAGEKYTRVYFRLGS